MKKHGFRASRTVFTLDKGSDFGKLQFQIPQKIKLLLSKKMVKISIL